MSFVAISAPLLHDIRRAAEAAYPAECCGLLVGWGTVENGVVVERIVASRNLAADGRNDRFEVDPTVRFETMRDLEGSDRAIVGHYHSHPDGPAEPSATDLEMAYEPELAWLIAASTEDRAGDIRAFRLTADARAFEPLDLRS